MPCSEVGGAGHSVGALAARSDRPPSLPELGLSAAEFEREHADMDYDFFLQRLIPYRLGAVSALTLALEYWFHWDSAVPMQIYFDGKLAIEGNSNGFTNPAIESGLIHCRALLEFLGLCEREEALQSIALPRRSDDIGIESFCNASGPLPLVAPSTALSRYTGASFEAEHALLAVFHATNKGLAHVTNGFSLSKADSNLIEVASRGVPALVVSHLYTPLGLPAPNFEIESRPRNGC